MALLKTGVQRAVATALAGEGHLGSLIAAPSAAADGPFDNLACKLSPRGMSQWVKKANSDVKGVKAFAAAVGSLSNQTRQFALDKWEAGEPATIIIDGGNPSPPLNLRFDDLVVPSLPVAPPPQTGSFDDTRPLPLRVLDCSGYRYQYLFDICMQGQLDPVYR